MNSRGQESSSKITFHRGGMDIFWSNTMKEQTGNVVKIRFDVYFLSLRTIPKPVMPHINHTLYTTPLK